MSRIYAQKKRVLSLALALVMLLSCTDLGLVTRTWAEEGTGTTISLSKLLATTYGDKMSDEEQAVLESDLLASDSYSYVLPTDDDDLITVKTDDECVTLDDFENAVNTDNKVSFDVSVWLADEDEKEYPLTLSDGKYSYANLEQKPTSFTAHAKYEAKIEMGTRAQQNALNTLLNNVEALQTSVKNFDAVKTANGNLTDLQTALATASTMNMVNQLLATKAAQDAAAALTKNGSEFALTTALKGSATQELLKNNFYNTLKATYDNVTLIANDTTWQGIKALYVVGDKPADNATGLNLSAAKAIIGVDKWLAAVKDLLDVSEDTTEWPVLDTSGNAKTGLVRADMENTDYTSLDKLIRDLPTELKGVSNFGDYLSTGDSVTLEKGVARYTVTVNATLQKVDADNKLTDKYSSGSTTVTLNKGADKAAVETAIASFKSQMDSAAKTYYGEGNYDVSGYPELGDSFGLSKDETYTVTYSPKQYTVTDWDGNETNYYYGYQLTLPENPTDGMVWEYKIGDVSYAQGEVYTVKGTTEIKRNEGKANTFYQVVASNYFGSTSDADKKAAAILTSGALKGNYPVVAGYPGNDSVEIKDGKLTAKTADSGYKTLVWKPYSYQLDTAATAVEFNGNYTVDLSSQSYSSVTVYYRLTLDGTADEALAAAQLPAKLATEAAAQKSALETLNGQYGNMEKVTPIVLNALKGAAESSTVLTSTQQTAYQTAFSNISARMEDNGKLKLYNLLTKYKEASDGLVYYYKNSGDFIGEVKALSENLNVLMEDETTFRQFLEATLKGLVSDTEIESLSKNLGTLKTKLGEVKTNLTAPNAKIDTDSDNLSDLVKALNMTGDLEEVSTGKGDAFLTTSLEVAAPDKVMIVVTVSGGGNTKTASVSVPENAAITQEQVNTLKTNVNNAIAALGIQTNYYTNNYNSGADLDDLVGEKPSEIDKGALAYTWTAIKYTVKIKDETDQTVTIENGKIKLPKAEAGYKYTYTIGSNTIVVGDSEDGSYTFGAEHFDDSSLFVGNTCTITRTTTNVSVDKLDKFVQSLNGTNGAITAKLSADRKTLTVTVDSGASGKKADMMSFALALVNNDYGYIGLKDEKDVSKAFINGGEVSVQALLDALTLESTTIANVIGEDGKVTTNNLLLTAPLQLGKDSAGNFEQELTLELRLAAEKQAPDSLIPLRNLSSLATFKLSGGELDITLNLPQEVYEVYLAALLLTGTDLDDINKLDKKVAYKFLWDLTQPTVDDTDAETYKNTITNTLGALGKDEKISAYLEKYEKYVNKSLKYLNNALTFDENGYTMSLNASATRLNQLINALLSDSGTDVSAFTSVVKELKEGGSVKVAVKADISNLDDRDYQALIFDRGEWNNGVKGKLDMIDLETNLADRLTEVKSTCGIILLKDIEAGLTFTTNTYLDLNGHKITGNVTVAAGAKLTVIDSSLATDSKAGIYGGLTVNGNLAILAGTYKNGESKTDVKTYLKNGYVQNDDGLVFNQYYTVVEDEKGNLTVELNADALNSEITNKTFTAQLVKATALDICGDIFLNYYATAMLKVDDETIFDVGEFDLVELWKDPNTKDALITKAADVFGEYGITALTNKIVKELTSFAKVAENIENGEDIISFKLETAPWRVWLKHNTEDNYLDLAIGSNKSDASAESGTSTASESAENATNGVVSKTMNVAVKIVGDDETKITKIANQFEKLSVIEVDAGIDYVDPETESTFKIKYADNKVTATGSAHADITVNLSEPEYAVVLGVILVSTADKNEIDDTVKVALAQGIEDYYDGKGVTKLKDAFDNVNVNNILKALAELNYKVDDKSMQAMFTSLGLTADTDKAEALGVKYYRLLDGFGWAADIALDALGKSDAGSGYNMAGLAANAEKYGQYVADKQDVTRKADKTIAGYTFYCEMKASSVSITVNLFQSTVSFDAGEGGTGSMESVLVKTGETYKLPACTFTAPTDKEFKCWSVGGEEKAVGDTITVNGPITITAVWQDKSAPTTYTVSGEVKSYDEVQSNVTVTLTDSENTVQTAITDANGKYEFTGIAAGTYTLSVTKSGCAKWTKTVAVTDTNVTENISIYLLGDVNLNGEVTADDLTTLARHVAKIEIITNKDSLRCADVTVDSDITADDLTLLARYVAKIVSSFD